MGETLDQFKKYEAGQDVQITRKEEDQEWSFDTWGDCRFQTKEGTIEEGNFYTDARIVQRLFTEPIIKGIDNSDKTKPITVVDFGGGTGIMLSQIDQQLQEAGFQQINPILIDADKEKIEHAKMTYPELQSKIGDAFHLPFEDNSIDAGVSRNLLQYFPPPSETSDKHNQFNILKEINRVTKPDSTLILIWPGAYKYESWQEKQRAMANDFLWSKITWDRTYDDIEDPFQTERMRSFTPGEVMAQFAQKAGFEIINGEEEDWIEFRYTDEAIINRFGEEKPIPEQQQRSIKMNFDPLHIHHLRGLDAIDYQGKQAIRLPISQLILRKVS